MEYWFQDEAFHVLLSTEMSAQNIRIIVSCTQCTPCIASVPVLFAQPMDLNVLLLDRCGPPTLQHTKWSYSNCGAAVQSTNTELSSKREQCPFRKKSYQCIQIIWCYAAFHGTLVEWMTHCSKSHRLKYIAASKDLTDTLVLKEVCALCALCTGNYNFYALFFSTFIC